MTHIIGRPTRTYRHFAVNPDHHNKCEPAQRKGMPSLDGGSLGESVYTFGEFAVDCGRFELRRNGQIIRLERKPLLLLIHLAASGGALVTRADIAETLWDPRIFVDSEHGINTAIRKIRAVLKDNPANPRYIKTVVGMGYQFIADTGRAVPIRRSEPERQPLRPFPRLLRFYLSAVLLISEVSRSFSA